MSRSLEDPVRLPILPHGRTAVAALSLALAASLAGCGSQAGSSADGTARSGNEQAALAATGTRKVTKLLVFVVENHSLDQMRRDMPFTHSLAKHYAYASSYYAIRHPSLPNYLAIAGGSTFGVADDKGPSHHRIKGRSVFGQALRKGRTAKLYADSMPGNCALSNSGNYAVRHNPWTYFVGERRACRRHDVPVSQLSHDAAAGRLPNAGMVIPDLVHDAHNATLGEADTWIEKQVTRIQRGPDWTSGRLAIVITADEDDHSSGNRVLTVVASRSVPHRVVSKRLTHYSLTRLYDDVLGVARLRNAKHAPSMTKAFGIPVR
jgi:acid phosphatase